MVLCGELEKKNEFLGGSCLSILKNIISLSMSSADPSSTVTSDSWEGGHPAEQEQFQRLSSHGVDIWWWKQGPAEATTHTVDSVGLQQLRGGAIYCLSFFRGLRERAKRLWPYNLCPIWAHSRLSCWQCGISIAAFASCLSGMHFSLPWTYQWSERCK